MWTTSQKNAIDAECADNLVSAAAGSGKTAILVERIITRILDGKTDIDKILVVTFTNAAASEMKSRLMTSIMKNLSQTDEPDRLNRQLMLINTASICTIDSFCLNILKNNFFRLGLEPDFKIADASELELIKNDVLGRIFEEYYKESDKEFLHLVDCYSSKNDAELFELILEIFKFTNSMPSGAEDLDKFLSAFSDKDRWTDYFVSKAKKYIEKAIEYYDIAIDNCLVYEDFGKVKELLTDEKNAFELALSKSDWDGLGKAIAVINFATMTFPRGTAEEDKLSVKTYREKAKAFQKELAEIFSSDYDFLCEDSMHAASSLEKIIEITKRFAREFTYAKLEKGVLDFADVEQMTLKLFVDENGNQSDVAKQIMNKFDEIYIDEYQDCNTLQEELFSLISRKNLGTPNVFMVGDMKQSIYGFRGSEPKLFKEKSDTYVPYGQGASYNKIVLNKNFRSRKSIIDGVNFIFSQIMSEKCGELDYNEEEYLYYNDDSYENVNSDTDKIDVVLFETNFSEFNDNKSDDASADLRKTEAEAIYVANKIKSIVNAKEPYLVYDKDKKDYRPAKFSDIVLLLRSGTAKAEVFDRILTMAQIPSYCETGEAYFDSLEISFLVSFLKIIDNPLDDIALLSVMRHPVFSFNEDEFVSIRLFKGGVYFYKSVLTYIDANNDSLSDKLRDFVNVLKGFYERSKHLSTDKLLWEIVRDTEYLSYLSFLPNAEIKKANVKVLISKAFDFEKTSYKGIFDFIRYIDSVKKSSKDVEGARILSDDEDVVRIMTIHKSKGLEFPIVFLCDASKTFNDNDITRTKVLMHRKEGFGLNYYDRQKKYFYELPQKKMLKDIKRAEMLSEEMRILYVALTRAREKLFILGSERNVNSKIKKLTSMISTEDFKISGEIASGARSYMDWILMSVLRDKTCSLYDRTQAYRQTYKSSVFDITLLHKNDVVLDLADNTEPRDFLTLRAKDGFDVSEILDFKYTHAGLSQLPANLSVTELRYRENEDNVFELYKSTKMKNPKFFDEQSAVTPAQIGTLTHLVMEKLDFTGADSPENIKKQISDMVLDKVITEDEAKYINADNIFRILNTDVGRKMIKNADKIRREYSFMYLIDACELSSDADADEKIVVQGTIDAFFEDEDGHLVVVDYKTDKIKGSPDDLKARYKPQLRYYCNALEKIFGKKVSNAYLMLLDIGDVIEC